MERPWSGLAENEEFCALRRAANEQASKEKLGIMRRIIRRV
jgi:hypothetical protein